MKKVSSIFIFLAILSAVNCQIDQAIIGGGTAGISDFPYTLALRRNNAFVCGAAAIHRLWAVSAASCLANGVTTPQQFTLRGGSTNRDVGGMLMNVELVVLSPLLSGNNFNVGLARVMATTPIEGFNIAIIPVAPPCTTECCNTCALTASTSTGWGIDDSGIQPLTLRQITLNAVALASCRSAWNTNFQNEWFCLESDVIRGFCSGDTGNPVVTNINGVRTLVGIVSSFLNCGANQNPSPITRLEDMRIRNWITWVVGV